MNSEKREPADAGAGAESDAGAREAAKVDRRKFNKGRPGGWTPLHERKRLDWQETIFSDWARRHAGRLHSYFATVGRILLRLGDGNGIDALLLQDARSVLTPGFFPDEDEPEGAQRPGGRDFRDRLQWLLVMRGLGPSPFAHYLAQMKAEGGVPDHSPRALEDLRKDLLAELEPTLRTMMGRFPDDDVTMKAPKRAR